MTRTALPIPLLVATLMALAACGATPAERRRPSVPMVPPPPLPARDVTSPAAALPGGELALATALERALGNNPELAIAAWDVEVGSARIVQARLRPNPLAGLTVEDVAGSGDRSGGEQAETTIRIGQPFELGGKRDARIDAASRGRDLAAWDHARTRLDVVARTTRAFIEVLGAQERLALNDEAVGLGDDVVGSVGHLVTAGREPTAEAKRAEVALAAARIDRAQSDRDLDAARQRLAVLWGGSPDFTRAAGRLDTAVAPPSLDTLLDRLPHNPDVARWEAELAQRQAALELAEANAYPDVTIEAGYRRFQDNGDNGFVFGAFVPLPVLDRNQGAIAEARHRLAAAREARRAAESQARAALREAYAELRTAGSAVETLRDQILPSATQAYRSIAGGYKEGRYRYLDVLDAQRTLIANRERLVRALTDYRLAQVLVERLTGGPLDQPDAAPIGGSPS